VELKRRLDPRAIFVGLYVLAFAIYIIVGLQPAEAANYAVSAELAIPDIGLNTDVTTLEFDGHQLNTPREIVGSYSRAENKTLLIGHSTTVFQDLDQIQLGNTINYDDKVYRVVAIDMVAKSEVKMSEILAPSEKDTIIIMTCAGQLLDDADATHRLMITASI